MMQNNAHSKHWLVMSSKNHSLVKLFNTLIADEVFKLPLHSINKNSHYNINIYLLIPYFPMYMIFSVQNSDTSK